MSSYYDSDDDVAWGPLTLREIKRTLKQARKTPNKRHTIQPPVTSGQSQKVEEMPRVIENDTDEYSLAEEVREKCQITSSSNEYFTPNTTLSSDKHCQFLQNANCSVYASCSEDRPTKAESNKLDDTQAKFVYSAANRETQFQLSIEQQTLVENTVNDSTSSYEDNESFEHLQDSCIMKSIDSSRSYSENFDDDNIIVLSSDDENTSFVTATSKYNQETADGQCEILVKQEVSSPYNKVNNELRTSYRSTIVHVHGDKPEYSHDVSSDEYSEDGGFADSSGQEPSESPVSQGSAQGPDMTVGGELPLPSRDFSPVQVPKIDLAAFDETADCLKLNDTLEDIERMLNTSTGSTSQDSSVIASVSSDQHTSSSHLAPVQMISGSFMQTSTAYLENDSTPRKNVCGAAKPISSGTKIQKTPMKTITKSHLPTSTDKVHPSSQNRNPTPRKMKSPTKINYNTNMDKLKVTPVGQFRVPVTPSEKVKRSPLNSKNIISPVAMYIKYSPKVPLTTHVKQNSSKTVKVFKMPPSPKKQTVKSNKENTEMFPQVIYQPAKSKVFTVNEKLNLPPSIDKLVTSTQLIKHERRLNVGRYDEKQLEDKLKTETDLTRSSISDSLLSETNQDVSILASKLAFKK